MAKNSRVSHFAFIVSALGLIANIISIGTTKWLVSVNYLKMSIGIFHHCDFGNQYCGGMSEISAIVDAQEVAWFRAVQALFLLACLGSLLTCVLIVMVLIHFFDTKGTFKIITAINFGAVVSEILALVFFSLHHRDVFVITNSEDYLGYSFYLAIVGVVFLFVCFVASAIEASQTSKVLLNMQHRITVWSTPYTLFVDQEA